MPKNKPVSLPTTKTKKVYNNYITDTGRQFYPVKPSDLAIRDTANFFPVTGSEYGTPVLGTYDKKSYDSVPVETRIHESLDTSGNMHFQNPQLRKFMTNPPNETYFEAQQRPQIPGYANGGMLNNNYLPQYGFGDWLQRNAGTIGTVTGTVLGGAVGSVVPGAGTALGASIGGSLGGSIGGTVQGNYEGEQAADAQMIQMNRDKRLMGQNSRMNIANQRLQGNNLQASNVTGTNHFAMGGKLGQSMGGGVSQNYTGQSHEGSNGGIEVDSQGNPTIMSGQQPVGLVEDGESSWTHPKTKEVYIFSDKVKF